MSVRPNAMRATGPGLLSLERRIRRTSERGAKKAKSKKTSTFAFSGASNPSRRDLGEPSRRNSGDRGRRDPEDKLACLSGVVRNKSRLHPVRIGYATLSPKSHFGRDDPQTSRELLSRFIPPFPLSFDLTSSTPNFSFIWLDEYRPPFLFSDIDNPQLVASLSVTIGKSRPVTKGNSCFPHRCRRLLRCHTFYRVWITLYEHLGEI